MAKVPAIFPNGIAVIPDGTASATFVVDRAGNARFDGVVTGTSGLTLTRFQAIGAGTAYTLTTTPSAIDLGTTDPSITITTPGTYLITGCCDLYYNAATFAAVRTATLKFRRTNNTAADLTGGSITFQTQIITTLTYTAGIVCLPATIYTTTNRDDVVTIFGDVSVAPTAGSFQVTQSQILAIRIA